MLKENVNARNNNNKQQLDTTPVRKQGLSKAVVPAASSARRRPSTEAVELRKELGVARRERADAIGRAGVVYSCVEQERVRHRDEALRKQSAADDALRDKLLEFRERHACEMAEADAAAEKQREAAGEAMRAKLLEERERHAYEMAGAAEKRLSEALSVAERERHSCEMAEAGVNAEKQANEALLEERDRHAREMAGAEKRQAEALEALAAAERETHALEMVLRDVAAEQQQSEEQERHALEIVSRDVAAEQRQSEALEALSARLREAFDSVHARHNSEAAAQDAAAAAQETAHADEICQLAEEHQLIVKQLERRTKKKEEALVHRDRVLKQNLLELLENKDPRCRLRVLGQLLNFSQPQLERALTLYRSPSPWRISALFSSLLGFLFTPPARKQGDY